MAYDEPPGGSTDWPLYVAAVFTLLLLVGLVVIVVMGLTGFSPT